VKSEGKCSPVFFGVQLLPDLALVVWCLLFIRYSLCFPYILVVRLEGRNLCLSMCFCTGVRRRGA